MVSRLGRALNCLPELLWSGLESLTFSKPAPFTIRGVSFLLTVSAKSPVSLFFQVTL